MLLRGQLRGRVGSRRDLLPEARESKKLARAFLFWLFSSARVGAAFSYR